MIDEIRGEHGFAAIYGSPRGWLELRRRGVRVGRKRVERIMGAWPPTCVGAGRVATKSWFTAGEHLRVEYGTG